MECNLERVSKGGGGGKWESGERGGEDMRRSPTQSTNRLHTLAFLSNV